MTNTLWNDLLTEQDLQVIDAAGYGQRGASTFASRKKYTSPALLVIDMQLLFVGRDIPILEAIAEAPTMIGEIGWRATEKMLPLITTCRQHEIPIIYGKMQPHNRPTDDPQLAIINPLEPQSTDTIINKTTSSIFHKTDLEEILSGFACDSVIVIGNSTSGCVRAAAVDAVQHGYTAIIPHDCVFDRIEASHKISLLDMWMKYAVVTSSETLIQQIHTQREVI